MNLADAKACAEIRKKIFLTAYAGGMAHLASSFSAVEVLYALYLKNVLHHSPGRPDMPERDRFVLSKGHGALALYAVLCEAGYLSDEMLAAYLKPYCCIGGEPNGRGVKGVEALTGSLGHGLPIALGMALAQKMDQNRAKTYVLVGDGESQEGSVWEAAMSAVAFHLDNLIVIVDCNKLQKAGTVEETMGCVDWMGKWKAFGWDAVEVDGHDTDAVRTALADEIMQNGRPTVVAAHTVKGKGVSVMENDPKWHFRLPNKKELRIFMEELGISPSEIGGLP